MEGQEAYGPGSWGITHLSCKLSVDIDVLKKKKSKPRTPLPALSLSKRSE